METDIFSNIINDQSSIPNNLNLISEFYDTKNIISKTNNNIEDTNKDTNKNTNKDTNTNKDIGVNKEYLELFEAQPAFGQIEQSLGNIESFASFSTVNDKNKNNNDHNKCKCHIILENLNELNKKFNFNTLDEMIHMVLNYDIEELRTFAIETYKFIVSNKRIK